MSIQPINEHLCIVNISFGPKGVHYMEVLLYSQFPIRP